MNKKIFLALFAGLIILAISLQVVGNRVNSGGDRLAINALKNFKYPGWVKAEVPLGDSPEVLQSVEKILGYDDVVSWSMESNGRKVQLYAAYWGAGKTSSKEVAMHTPDNCWVSAGWTQVVSRERALSFDNIRLNVAQDRIFSIHGIQRSVVFWHVYGNRVISYGKVRPSFWDGVRDACRDGLRLRKEQVFIRISSDANMDDVETWDAFRSLLRLLEETVPSLSVKAANLNKDHKS